jgi:SAM-dependent methyltransferase
VKLIFPEFFTHKLVLDVGGGDINGNNRFLFDSCGYAANDVVESKNVTVVSRTKDLPFGSATFDTIISTECFEHDPEYQESFKKIYDMLKPGGIFVFTCASTDRPEHGTRRTCPDQSYGTIGNIPDMMDYYKNLTIEDIKSFMNLDELFATWRSYYNSSSKDLYFYGIKKHSVKCEYVDPFISRTGF